MLKALCLCCIAAVSIAKGHNNKLVGDGDMQSALMPQELNPVFVPDDTALEYPTGESGRPWKTVLPIPRMRRDMDIHVAAPVESTTMQQVKTYSRIVAGAVIALSAIVEIVVYVIEIYYV